MPAIDFRCFIFRSENVARLHHILKIALKHGTRLTFLDALSHLFLCVLLFFTAIFSSNAARFLTCFSHHDGCVKERKSEWNLLWDSWSWHYRDTLRTIEFYVYNKFSTRLSSVRSATGINSFAFFCSQKWRQGRTKIILHTLHIAETDKAIINIDILIIYRSKNRTEEAINGMKHERKQELFILTHWRFQWKILIFCGNLISMAT